MQSLAELKATTQGFVRAGIAGTLQAFLGRYPHVNADHLLRASGLPPEKLGKSDALLSLRSCLEFMENAATETGDACFGLEYAAQLPWNDLGVLGYVMANSPTLGVGLKDACRYFAVQQTLGTMSFSQTTGEARVTYNPDESSLGRWGQNVEFMLLLIVRFCRESAGQPDWRPLRVELAHIGPTDASRHERFFGAPVRFAQVENALIVSTADLELPLRLADPALLPILRSHADNLLSRMPTGGDFVLSVRRLLTDAMNAGNANIEHIASRLSTTPRSLQRRLRESGSSFQQLLSETRLALSQRYLTDHTLSLTEIAFLLGYSELSAFSRAYRRWTGRSPLDFRRRSL